MNLIKIKEEHYVIVDDSKEIKSMPRRIRKIYTEEDMLKCWNKTRIL